jgi:hypothetical protein
VLTLHQPRADPLNCQWGVMSLDTLVAYASVLCFNTNIGHQIFICHCLGLSNSSGSCGVKPIRHITIAKNMKHWLSAIVTGITLYHLMVICFYILACHVQTTGFASLMLVSNSLSLSPSTHNWCSIHSQQTSILYFAYILVSQFHSGWGSFHKQTLECGT